MSEWNLSVRLTGQGSSLTRTLQDVASDARSASNEINALRRNLTLLRTEASNDIRVRLDMDADHLRRDVTAALTTAGTGQGLRVRLDLNADHLRNEVQAAITTAGAGQGLGVNLTLTDPMQLRRDVENAVRWAAHGHRIEIPLVLADLMQLRRDVSNAVRWASMDQTITVRVNPDTSSLRTLTRGLTNGGGGGGGNGNNAPLRGFLLLAPAAIPLAAGLASTLAPLPAQFAAAGVAGAAFGIAIAGQIGPLSNAADAEKKYQDAVVQHGKNSKEAMEASLAYQQKLAQLAPASQQAAIALSTLKGTFSDWSDDMSRFTMEPVTHGIAVLDELIPRLTPHVKSASTQLDRLVTIAGGAVATPGFDAMANRFADFSDQQLDKMTDGVIHFLRVLSEGGAFRSGPIAEFMAYARENGPAAREALKAISDAVVTLLRGASQAGPSMLILVTAAAKLVAALPPELVGIILQVAAALKLLQLSGAGFAALAGGLGRVRTAIAGLGTAAATAGGGIAGLRAAFMSLGVAARASIIIAGIAAVAAVVMKLSENSRQAPPDVDKLTNSLRELGSTGKVAGEAAKAFGKDLSGLHDRVRALTDPATADKVQQFLVGWTGWDSTPVKDAKENIESIDQALAGLVKNGQADLAAEALKRLTAEYGKGGKNTSKFTKELDDYKTAIADAKFEQELAVQSMGIFGNAAQDTSAKLDAQKRSADGLRQSITALNDTNRSAYDAQIQFEQSIDDLTAAFKENGATLDINTEAGRKNGQAMSTVAKSHDEMIAAGLAAGESLGSMTKKSDTLRSTMLRLATEAFDGNKRKAQDYVNTLLGTPDEIKTMVRLERQEAITGLKEVQAEIEKTPGAKRVVVDTLNAAAIAALEAVGLKTKQLPDGRTEVFTANGQSLGSVDAVRRALDNLDGKTANTYTNNTITTTYVKRTVYDKDANSIPDMVQAPHQANGSVLSFYARGGMNNRSEQHVAQIAPAGAWRVWAEDETGGESYIPLSPAKRPRSRAIAEETVRRLGGDPHSIQWNANGNVTDWTYDPSTGSLYSATDAGQAGHKTKKVKVKGKNGKTTTKDVDYFDLGAVEKKLKSTAKATRSWNTDLEKVADRLGGDVAEALAGMGEDGIKLAHKMATGSKKYAEDMAKALRDLAKVAKASLTDYTRQLTKVNAADATFTKNLSTLAGQGYGDLAAQLAAQGGTAAQELAAAAVKDRKKASSANTAAKKSNTALTSDQVQQLVAIIAAVKTSKTGIHDVAGTTGLGEDEIIATATKAQAQIKSSLGSRATKFLGDLARANKGMSYANGGIREGIYASQGGLVRWAEPETGGEAYIPLGPNKRTAATNVLRDVAARFGVGLTDVSATRPVVIVQGGGDTNVTVTAVRTGATATDIASQVGRQMRRVRRGGVNARVAA